jgi:hypothetical protein
MKKGNRAVLWEASLTSHCGTDTSAKDLALAA